MHVRAFLFNMAEADIVIHCPNPIHSRPINKLVDGKVTSRVPDPKILFIASPDAIGQFKVQCGDHRCVLSGDNRGWYIISLNGAGGQEVQPVTRKMLRDRFNLKKVPYVLIGD